MVLRSFQVSDCTYDAVALLIENSGRQDDLNDYLYIIGVAQPPTGSNNVDRSSRVFHRKIPEYNGMARNNQPVNTRGKYFNYMIGLGTPIVYCLIPKRRVRPGAPPIRNQRSARPHARFPEKSMGTDLVMKVSDRA